MRDSGPIKTFKRGEKAGIGTGRKKENLSVRWSSERITIPRGETGGGRAADFREPGSNFEEKGGVAYSGTNKHRLIAVQKRPGLWREKGFRKQEKRERGSWTKD